MGENGEGSLEAGATSGEDFVIRYASTIEIDDFVDKDGIINEFALLYRLRTSFVLHYTIFKQVSSHLCHETNTEQTFSLAGDLSDDNGKMDPYTASASGSRSRPTARSSSQGLSRPLLGAVRRREVVRVKFTAQPFCN